MLSQVLDATLSIYLPYFTPIIFILLSIVVADRLRETIMNAFDSNFGKTRRTE